MVSKSSSSSSSLSTQTQQISSGSSTTSERSRHSLDIEEQSYHLASGDEDAMDIPIDMSLPPNVETTKQNKTVESYNTPRKLNEFSTVEIPSETVNDNTVAATAQRRNKKHLKNNHITSNTSKKSNTPNTPKKSNTPKSDQKSGGGDDDGGDDNTSADDSNYSESEVSDITTDKESSRKRSKLSERALKKKKTEEEKIQEAEEKERQKYEKEQERRRISTEKEIEADCDIKEDELLISYYKINPEYCKKMIINRCKNTSKMLNLMRSRVKTYYNKRATYVAGVKSQLSDEDLHKFNSYNIEALIQYKQHLLLHLKYIKSLLTKEDRKILLQVQDMIMDILKENYRKGFESDE